MPRRRPVILAALLAAAAALAVFGTPIREWLGPRHPVPAPPVHVAIVDPYATEPLLGYGELRDALRAGDLETVSRIAFADDSYRAYRAALTLAESPTLDPRHRLDHYERVLALRVEDPLEREQRRDLMLEVGRVAEAAGERPRALEAYREALPRREAITAVARLEPDPYRLSNAYFQAGLHRHALDALGGRAAPSIEAPAHRALGNHRDALDAFSRWVAEVPGSLDARVGVAWSLFSLERWDEADAAFAALPGGAGLYGRGLIASRLGAVDRGVTLLLATGVPSQMWLATSWLETRGRLDAAVDAYLRIARGGDATYADDAAYRAFVLASRLGDATRADEALSLVPDGSYFALLLGRPLEVPTGSTLETGDPPEVLALARALAIVQDFEAARGELVFALRAADDPAEVVAVAEALQQVYGEYRQSQRAAMGLIGQGLRDARVWRLAYPRAYAAAVTRYAESHEIEPELVWSIMRQESAFSPVALSRSNAQGLMQVIPSTWDWIAELLREPPDDPWDPDANVRYGIYYLRWLADYHGEDLELMVTSYNRGQGYIRRLYQGQVAGDKDDFYRFIDALETREYLQRVMVNLETYRQLYDSDRPSLAEGRQAVASP
jgi:soluble lytic murein transglycosylase